MNRILLAALVLIAAACAQSQAKKISISQEAKDHYNYIVAQFKPLQEQMAPVEAKMNELRNAASVLVRQQCESAGIKPEECRLDWDKGEISKVTTAAKK